MSSPSPDLQKTDHLYLSKNDVGGNDDQTAAILTHPHQCTCTEKPSIDQISKTDSSPKHGHRSSLSKSSHHAAVINLSHPPTTTSHIHPIQSVPMHVHASLANTTCHSTKVITNSICTCHVMQEISDNGSNEVESANQYTRKIEADDRIEVSPLPPALPPRPPPRQRFDGRETIRPQTTNPNTGGGVRKYVFWCCACGGLATILGALFLAVYFLLRSYTSTLGYFETIPTFVPATMLILTGLCVISLARRRNRYSYLIKVCGICCLVCALTCVLVTITTTVIHMNRLQTLRECVYTQKTRTCTCYSVLTEAHTNADDGMRYVFDSTPDCEVIHGALYSCLRAMFGLSVSGILVCIFSCMLVYQLLSHEKKKMYWEQLELRCRSFYQQHSAGGATGSVRGGPPPVVPSSAATYCSCCEECRYPALTGPQVYPWDTHSSTDRFWTPGRIGNFYSPNPGEELPPSTMATNARNNRSISGWNWRRLPWNRSNGQNERDNSMNSYEGAGGSADSQYGFSNRSGGENAFISDPISGSTGSYSVLDNRPPVGGVYVWGPPPPYSNPNSPARRPMHSPARYHHVHHHMHSHESHCQMNEMNNPFRGSRRTTPRTNNNNKDNYENTTETEVHQTNENNSESTDTSSCVERTTHTLPVRKIKKRQDIASVKSINQTNDRTNVQNVFKQNNDGMNDDEDDEQKTGDAEYDYQEPNQVPESNKNTNEAPQSQCRFLPRLQGVENAAFQKQENNCQKKQPETTESEVYFADVSSCCTVRNDGQDSSLYEEAVDSGDKPRLLSLQKEVKESTTAIGTEDYLMHNRMSSRQMSTRSRMPLPLPTSDDLADFNTDPCLHLLPKDMSQNSLCSSVQTPMTETTDDAVTPSSEECCNQYFQDSEQKRPFTSTVLEHLLAPDAQYEVIQEQDNFRSNSNLTNTISTMNNFDQSNFYNHQSKSTNFNNYSLKNQPPKTLNLNQSQISPCRRNISSNISALIQNLNGHQSGLLYGQTEEEIQGQGGCHSDGTMDSGWQSGSEKIDRKSTSNNSEIVAHKSVNI